MVRVFFSLLLISMISAAQAEGFEYLQVFGVVSTDDCGGACQQVKINNPVVGGVAGMSFGGTLGLGVEAMLTDRTGTLNLTASRQTSLARFTAGVGAGVDWGVDAKYVDDRANRSKSNNLRLAFIEASRGWGFVRLVRFDSSHRFHSSPVLGVDGNGDQILGPRETLKADVDRWALFAGARFEY